MKSFSNFFLLMALPSICLSLIDTQVTVTYTLTCDRQNTFWYEMQLLEENFFSDDLLGKTSGTGQQQAQGIITGRDNDDHNSEFDFFLYIKHNCGANGKTKRVNLKPPCTLNSSTCNYDVYVLLTRD